MQPDEPEIHRPSVGTTLDEAPPPVRPDFDTFYRVERPQAVRTATLLTQNRAVAEELVQDAFAKVYRAWTRADQPGPYFNRTLINTCNEWHRRNNAEQRRLEKVLPDDADALAFDELADAVAALPAKYRTVLVLRYYRDFTEAQIAEVMGCRPGTVKSLASRALERLEKVIER